MVSGQDYTMYETHTLTPKMGSAEDLDKAIAQHNKLYHADGPYKNYMFSIINGPRTGDILFAMGSCTFSQLDERPSSKEHNKDWAKVLSHTKDGAKNVEYWVLNEELSSPSTSNTDDMQPLCKVRYFDVADNSDFIELQGQVKKTIEAMGITTPRYMYRNRFQNKQGRDWALVTWYDNWTDFDNDKWDNFKETFIELFGENRWTKLDIEFDQFITSREDEMRYRRLDLQGEEKK